jgi:hypothetical protein
MLERDRIRRAALTAVHRRTRLKLAEVQLLLAPELPGLLPALALATYLAKKMVNLSPEERDRLVVKMAAARAEMDALVAMLSQEAQVIRDDVRKLTSHGTAAVAYGRSARGLFSEQRRR